MNKLFFVRRIPKVYESKLFDSCSQEVQMWAINNAIRATESDYNIGQALLATLPGDFHAKTLGRWGADAVRHSLLPPKKLSFILLLISFEIVLHRYELSSTSSWILTMIHYTCGWSPKY